MNRSNVPWSLSKNERDQDDEAGESFAGVTTVQMNINGGWENTEGVGSKYRYRREANTTGTQGLK